MEPVGTGLEPEGRVAVGQGAEFTALQVSLDSGEVFLPRSIVVVGDMRGKVDLRDAAGQVQQLGHRRRGNGSAHRLRVHPAADEHEQGHEPEPTSPTGRLAIHMPLLPRPRRPKPLAAKVYCVLHRAVAVVDPVLSKL